MKSVISAALSFVLLLSTASARMPRGAAIGVAAPSSPTFIQGTGSDLNDNNGITGNAFIINLPNTTGSGNAIVLSMAYPFLSGRTVAISDSCGDTWPAASVTAGTASASNMNTRTYVLPNATGSCLHTLTVTFDTFIKPFQYTLAEFNNIATSAPADGSSSTPNTSCATISAGSYTPSTNNDGNGGHLIWNYAISNDTVGTALANQASAISKSGGVSPAFMHANNISTIPSASSFDVQTTNGAVNPGFGFTQATGTNCLDSSLALKVASAGTPAPGGIRVKRMLHYTVVNPQNGANVFLFPSDGNLLVTTIAPDSSQNLISSMVDSNSQSYTSAGSPGNSQVFYHQNATSGNNLKLTVSLASGGQPQFSIHFWDVVGAQASSFLNTAGFNGVAPGSGFVISDFPIITPSAAPGLVINQTGSGTASQGGMAAGAPAGSVFDGVSYTITGGLFDQDRMDNADQFGHANYSTTATQHWNFSMTAQQQGSTAFATAVAFQ